MIEEQVNEDILTWQGVGVDGDGAVDVKMAAEMIGYGGRYHYSFRTFLISKS